MGEQPEEPDLDESPEALPAERARAGETSGHVRIILGVSMSLTVIGMGVLLLAWMTGT